MIRRRDNLRMWWWRNTPFIVTEVYVWPDMEPMLPTSKGVRVHTANHRYATPLGVWKHEQVGPPER